MTVRPLNKKNERKGFIHSYSNYLLHICSMPEIVVRFQEYKSQMWSLIYIPDEET